MSYTRTIKLIIPGPPVGQGSVRALRSARAGAPSIIRPNNPEQLARFRADIRTAVDDLDEPTRAALPLEGPVAVGILASLARPRAHYRTGAHFDELRPSAPVLPTRTPDIDKVARAVLDALVSAGVLDDDAQVAELIVWKRYAQGHPSTEVLCRDLARVRH